MVFVLLIFYGLRRGEVLGLRWDDIDLMAGRSTSIGSSSETTLEIYTDTDEQARRDALTRLQSLLGDTRN